MKKLSILVASILITCFVSQSAFAYISEANATVYTTNNTYYCHYEVYYGASGSKWKVISVESVMSSKNFASKKVKAKIALLSTYWQREKTGSSINITWWPDILVSKGSNASCGYYFYNISNKWALAKSLGIWL